MFIRITYGYKLHDTGKWTYTSTLAESDKLDGAAVGVQVSRLINAGAVKVTVKKEIV